MMLRNVFSPAPPTSLNTHIHTTHTHDVHDTHGSHGSHNTQDYTP
jgi:hypothetical protein